MTATKANRRSPLLRRLALPAALQLLMSGTAAHAAGQKSVLGPVRTTIGVLDQPLSEVLGSVRDIDVDANGNVYVLDEYQSSIRVFDRVGKLRATAGRDGQGPGEFRSVRGAALDEDGLLHVVDAGNRRISTFELTDNGLVFKRAVRLSFPPYDICIIGMRRFVLLGFTPAFNGALIREVDVDGRVINAFAEREKPDAELRKLMGERDDFLNYAFLTCDPTSRTVFLLHRDVPLVRAFSPDGTQLWRSTIEAYHRQQYALTARGGCCMYMIPDPESNTFHVARAVTADGTGHLLLSLTEVRWQPLERLHELRVLDVRSGREVARHRTDAMVLKAQLGLIYAYMDDPFPQLRIITQRE